MITAGLRIWKRARTSIQFANAICQLDATVLKLADEPNHPTLSWLRDGRRLWRGLSTWIGRHKSDYNISFESPITSAFWANIRFHLQAIEW